jgi:hypothetical protein
MLSSELTPRNDLFAQSTRNPNTKNTVMKLLAEFKFKRIKRKHMLKEKKSKSLNIP